MGREHGRRIPLLFRHLGERGEFLWCRIQTDHDAGSIHLLPECPWPFARDRHGNWLEGRAAIDLIGFLREAESRGGAADWRGRLQQGLFKLAGEREDRRLTLTQLRHEDPELYERVNGVRDRHGLSSAVLPVDDGESYDDPFEPKSEPDPFDPGEEVEW